MSYDFQEIANHFNFEGTFIKADPYGFGHINDTFAIYFKKSDGTDHRYLIQRINHNVFLNPENLMHNIEGVTRHLRKKIISVGGDPDRETLNLVSTIDDKSYYISTEGDYWRAYIFIEGAHTYQIVENLQHLCNAGKAFGKFQMLMSDFPADQLHETIINFHNTGKRYAAFEEAL